MDKTRCDPYSHGVYNQMGTHVKEITIRTNLKFPNVTSATRAFIGTFDLIKEVTEI